MRSRVGGKAHGSTYRGGHGCCCCCFSVAAACFMSSFRLWLSWVSPSTPMRQGNACRRSIAAFPFVARGRLTQQPRKYCGPHSQSRDRRGYDSKCLVFYCLVLSCPPAAHLPTSRPLVFFLLLWLLFHVLLPSLVATEVCYFCCSYSALLVVCVSLSFSPLVSPELL